MDRTEMKILRHIDNVPQSLKDLPQWVAWRNVERDGRKTKMPINAIAGSPAKSNDPTTWTDFDSACDGAVGLGASGVGFCFSEADGLVGVDLDACISADEKTIDEWALKIICRFATYIEISPSKRGLKMWCRGKIDKGYRKNLGDVIPDIGKAPGIEVYTTGRYFTVTGERWEGAREEVGTCQEDLDWLIKKYWSASGPDPVQTTETQAATYTKATSGQELSKQERAARYLSKMPPAVSGEHGHDKTYRVACVLMLGFALSVDEAWPVIAEWNQGCNPPWSDADLRRKLDQANQQGGDRGFLLTGNSFENPSVDCLGEFMQQFDQPAAPAGIPATAAEPEELTPADIVPSPENFPQEAMQPPGFIGDMIQHILDTSMYPIPELALASQLALMSTLCGQKIEDAHFGTRPNGYFVGLMPSGGGKDHARMKNKDLLREAGVPELEGEENFASSASIWSAADEQPVGLYMLDEMASLLATTHDAKGAPHLYKITDTFLRLFSSSKMIIKADAYADRKKNKVVHYPNIVIYGTSVAKKFWESLSGESVTDGLLGRFMIFEPSGGDRNGYVDPVDDVERKPIPERLVAIAAAWRALKTHSGNLAGMTGFEGANPIGMKHTPEALERAKGHQRAVCEQRKQEEAEAAAVWTRTPEKTNKLALLFAASRATLEQLEQGELPMIELQDVDRAIALSNWLTRRLLHKAGLHVAHSDFERECQRALAKMQKDKEITRRGFTRMVRHLDTRKRGDVLQTLVDGGFISHRQEANANGRTVDYFSRII
jgi:hypothetical protein